MECAAINGAELAYEDLGDGAPVLLIHGTGAYTAVWGDIPQRLAERHRVIAYDRRGFGASGGQLAERLEDQVNDAAALLDHLGVEAATVVGWSAGGTIAAMLAGRHPERVASLVLSEPAIRLAAHASARALSMQARLQIAATIRRNPGAAAAMMYRWHTPAGTGAVTFDEYPAEWRMQMIDHAPATLREIRQQTTPKPGRAEIASIKGPVTVMIGDRSDSSFPRIGRYLMKTRPDTRWVDLPGAGHTPHLDCPDLWVQTVADASRAATRPDAEAREQDASAAPR